MRTECREKRECQKRDGSGAGKGKSRLICWLLGAISVLFLAGGARAAEGPSSNRVQDPYSFFLSGASFSNIETNQDTVSRSLKVEKSSEALVEAYVQMLASQNGNLKLVHVTDNNYNYGLSRYYSAVLSYQGNAYVGGTIKELYDSSYEGHVMIYFARSPENSSGRISLSRGLEFEDLGYRSDGSRVQTGSLPPSAGASLRKEGGRYVTDDGRLGAEPGTACVRLDGGRAVTIPASLTRVASIESDEIRIKNYRGSDGMSLRFPSGAVKTGDVLTQKQLGNQYGWGLTDVDELFGYTALYGAAAVHNGIGVYLNPDPYKGFLGAYVKVMLWDEAAELGVLYICFSFDTTPCQVEALAVLPFTQVRGGNAEDVFLQAGESRQLTMPKGQRSEGAEVFRWDILEGADIIEVSNPNGQTCTVKALRDGEAVLRGHYLFWKLEPDVLTGVTRKKEAQETKDFLITVGSGAAPTPTPRPTAAPAATATPTPRPTAAPAATATPTPRPTAAPAATATPVPRPTAAPTPTPTLAPGMSMGKNSHFVVGKLAYRVIKQGVSGKAKVSCTGQKNFKGVVTIYIPSTVTYQGIDYLVTEVDPGAFEEHGWLLVVKIGNNVVSIGDRAFYRCLRLETVVMGKRVKKIGKKAFGGNSSLQYLQVKTRKLTSIGKKAFAGTNLLEKVQVAPGCGKAYKKLFRAAGLKKNAVFLEI